MGGEEHIKHYLIMYRAKLATSDQVIVCVLRPLHVTTHDQRMLVVFDCDSKIVLHSVNLA